MPTVVPLHASRARKAARRPWLGWAWGDWALFVAAYLVIAGAVLFATPESRDAPHGTMVHATASLATR